MNLRKFTFLLAFLALAALPAFAQTDSVSIQTIMNATGKFNHDRPVEKVYLHFDKPYYALGDSVWFKAYLTTDIHQPSTLSKIVYVDVISSKDSIVQSLKLPVTGSTAFGDITLSAPLYKEGNYHFRAYTKWMQNFDPAYFFNKTIAVGTLVDKDVFADFSLSSSVKSNTAKVNAALHYTTPDGRAYPGKKVTWNVQDSDDETISKGKGTTDVTGNITVSFATAKIDALKSATLYTAIDLDNKTVKNSFSLKQAALPTDVQFFPEGGELIDGVSSKVAFKAIKPDGLGADIKGTVTDNNGTVVASIASQHLGMGVFDLLPQSGKTYKATITFPDGSQNTYNLPEAKTDGITLAVNNADLARIGIGISASDAYFKANKNKTFYLLVQNGQRICYAAKVALGTQVYSASIPKSKITTGSGVTRFTLLATNGEELAERVIFIKANDLLNINLSSEKTTYSPREKVTINVTAKKPNQQPSPEANLSVAVLDDQKVPVDENTETTILTSLLLTSDLKGYIEKPNYYFIHNDTKTNADLDVLMLTQGYTRFEYKDVLANTMPPVKFLPEDGIDITGTLHTSTGMTVNRGNVNLVIKDKHINLNTITDPVGVFKFSKLYIPDSLQGTISAKGNFNSEGMMILVDNDSYQVITPNVTAPDGITNIDTALSAYLKNNKQQMLNSHVLKQVDIKDVAVQKPSHEDYPVLTGLNHIPDQVIEGDHMDGCVSVFECLKGLANSLTVDDDNIYIRRDYMQGNKSPMQVYYNGMPVDYNYLENISPSDIESAEIFLSDGLSGINKMTNTNGVLVVNGKKVVKNRISHAQWAALLSSIHDGEVNIMPRGYSTARVFYSPRYDIAKNATMGGDWRSTIFWSPQIITDKNGTASFGYFNADGKGTYRVIIEGIDADGNIGRTVYHYNVE